MSANIQRLDKVLSNSGYGTRKEVKKIIKQGSVMVNNSVVLDVGTKVDPETDIIEVAGRILDYKANIYIMLNKPSGVLSTTYDKTETTVIDLLYGEYSHRDLFPVGRLDIDTEGLVLLTDDGQLAHRLLSPKNMVPKLYYVEVNGRLDEQDVSAFNAGICLGDFTTLSSELEILQAGDKSTALVKIYEGKFHQIKRMMQARNKEVVYLKRLSIGPLELDEDLDLGQWRELTCEEISLLQKYV
jgi:16S rRNA pseudouridine516 synthase